MNVYLIVVAALAGVVVMLLFIASKYQKTLQSKKTYDQMTMLMKAERLMIDEDRLLFSTEKKL